MNKNPGKKAFWRLFSPLVAYWLVQIVVSFLTSFVMMIVKAGELAPVLFVDSENATEAELQTVFDTVNRIALEFYRQYQLECATASALCLILVMGIMFWQDRKKETTFVKAAPAVKYSLILGLGISVCLAANCLVGLTELAFVDEAYQEAAAVLYGPPFLIQILCSGIIIPVSEELFFRGVVFKRFRERIGFMGAAFISSFIFSAGHGNLVQALYTVGLGMLLAYAYEKYGSFKAPLCLHITANLVSLFCTRFGVFDWLMQNRLGMALLAVAGTFVGTVMFVNIQKIEGTTNGEIKDEPGIMR